ncbi:MAG: hypothetical protein WBQ73_02335 [Candidatus Babeliales bacterium]
MGRKNYEVCCQIFQYWLEDPTPQFFYNKACRVYSMTAPEYLLKKKKIKAKDWPSYQIFFCPVCGSKFPSDLTLLRQEILKREYGIEDSKDPLMQKLIPEKFLTDVWWKERGL